MVFQLFYVPCLTFPNLSIDELELSFIGSYRTMEKKPFSLITFLDDLFQYHQNILYAELVEEMVKEEAVERHVGELGNVVN